MHRLFINPDQYFQNQVHLSRDQAHHYGTVLKLRQNAPIDIIIQPDKKTRNATTQTPPTSTQSSNTSSIQWIQARVVKFDQHILHITQAISQIVPKAPSPKIILCQSLPKLDKMTEIVKKTTELGVSEIIPFQSQRSEVKTVSESKHQRWKAAALSAAEQSRLFHVPIIHPVQTSLTQLIHTLQTRQAKTEDSSPPPYLCCWEEEENYTIQHYIQAHVLSNQTHPKSSDASSSDLDSQQTEIIVIIGPEGGFSQEEIRQLPNTQTVSLGRTILRVENAAFYVMAALRVCGKVKP